MSKRKPKKYRRPNIPMASRTSAAKSKRLGMDRSFNPDYSYVVKDLKRIGVLAGSFVVILVALSFILK